MVTCFIYMLGPPLREAMAFEIFKFTLCGLTLILVSDLDTSQMIDAPWHGSLYDQVSVSGRILRTNPEKNIKELK